MKRMYRHSFGVNLGWHLFSKSACRHYHVNSLARARSARKRSRPYIAECDDHGSNPVQGTIFFLHFYCLRLTRLTFNKS